MRPAARALSPTGQRDLVVAVVPIDEELADRSLEHAHRRLARAAAREDVRNELSLDLVAPDEAPEPRPARVPLRLDALGGLIGEHDPLLRDELQKSLVQRLGQLGATVKQISERRVVHLDACAAVGLRLAVERQRVGALRDRDLRDEGRAEAHLVEDLRRRVRSDDGLAAATADLLLHVELALDARGDELVQLRHLALAERREVVAATLRAALLVLADLVHDLASDELPLLLGVLAPLLLRRDPLGLGARRIADRLGDGRHLLGARAELMALERLERRLDLREPGFERLRPVPPLAQMVVAAHRGL